jgi:hypothetical protein
MTNSSRILNRGHLAKFSLWGLLWGLSLVLVSCAQNVRRRTIALLDASKEIDLEINAEEPSTDLGCVHVSSLEYRMKL